MERVALVTGATGFMASHLVPELAARGWRVRASGRRPRPDTLPEEVEYQSVDLVEDELEALTEGVDDVFHLAGASSTRSSDEEMQRTNVVGTERLMEAARKAGLERFCHFSTTAVYGEEVQLPLPVREDVEPHPSRGYGKAKWGAEEVVWRAAEEGVAVVVLRPVSVYGPGAIKLLGSAILDVALERWSGLDRLVVHEEPVEQRLVHVADVVAAAVHLLGCEAAWGRAFNVTSGLYPTSLEVAGILAREFGMELELSSDPDCGPGSEERTEIHGRMLAEGMNDDIVLTEDRFRFMRKSNRNNRLSIDALLGTGFQLTETDFPDSVARNIAWYREHRWIL